MRKLSSILLFLFLTTAAWAETQPIEFNGSTFQPEVYKFDGRSYYNTNDQEVLNLIGSANITSQWSSSGHTMFCFAPGRESYWSVGSETCKVNNEERKAPGKVIVKDGKRYIEPSALFFAMACRGNKEGGGYSLHPVITQVTQSDTGFLLRSASKAHPKVVENGQQTVFTLEGYDWDGDSNKLVLGDTTFEFQGGANQDEPLTVTVTPPTFYAAELGGSTLLNETKIDIVPNFEGADQANDVSLEKLYAAESEGKPMLVMDFNGGAKLHYLKDTVNKTLKIYVPRASFDADTFRSPDWKGLEVAIVETSKYPVLEITVPQNDDGFEFVTLEDSPHSVALIRGRKGEVKELAATGSVETPGWMDVRGTIVIDPGHGGSDTGCQNRALGVHEADVTLAICKHLATILRAQGWNVVLTRETDRDVTYAGSPDRMELEARADVANNIHADLFMSVHCNASVNTGAQGSSIHWWKPEDYAFAQALEPVLGPAIGLGQGGIIRNRFMVLRATQMPAVLVETAFLTNSREGAKLSDPDFQKVIAQQLAGGLANYMHGAYASRGKGKPAE